MSSNTPTIESLQAELARLQEENHRLQAQVDSLRPFQILAERSHEAVLVTTLQGTIAFANRAYRQLYGYSDDEPLAGRDVVSHARHQDSGQFQRFFEQLLSTGYFHGVIQETKIDGTPFTGMASIFVIADEQNQPQQFISFFRDITDQQNNEQRLQIFDQMIENAPDGVAYMSSDRTFLYANSAFRSIIGRSDELLGMSGNDVIDLSQADDIRGTLASAGKWTGRTNYRHKAGHMVPVAVTAFMLKTLAGESLIGLMVRDITAVVEAEAEHTAMQEQIIQAQQAALRELSTPLIPLAEGIIAMPIVGTIDSNRAMQILETLLEGINTHQAEKAILDLTGVKIMDTQVANALMRAAQAAKLLGADVTLSGISAEVAQTLVHLGVDLSTITTQRDLQQSIAAAFGHDG